MSVFDLDHTLIRCNVSAAFGRYLLKRGLLSLLRYCTIALAYLLHRGHLLSLRALHTLSFRLLFYRTSKKQVDRYAHEFLTYDFFRPEMVALLQAAQQSGERVFIYSSSPSFLVEPLAKMVGVEQTCASSYMTNAQGLFTSVNVLDGAGKQRALPTACHATVYTDSILDLPLLEEAALPVAVHPDKRLFSCALQRGWPILL